MNGHRNPRQAGPCRRDRRRAAFSMAEVVIALAIFTTVMTLVLGSLTSMTKYSTQESNQTDMVIQGREAARLITNDIANSSWLFAFDQTNTLVIYTGVPNTIGYVPTAPYQNNPLLPWVWIDGIQPDGKSFSGSANYTLYSPSTPLNPIVTSGNPAWEKDTFEYLKVRTTDRVAYSPKDERYEIIDQQTTPVATLDTFASAPPAPFLILNSLFPPGAGANDIFVSHVWEAGLTGSRAAANAFAPLSFNRNQDPSYLRHYHLEVINSAIMTDNPSLQLGSLVRTYWNGDGSSLPIPGNDTINTGGLPGWNADDQQVLLYNNVESFVVRTIYQPIPNAPTLLQPNQVSITIVLQEKTASPGVYLPQTISFITSMRSLAQ